MKKITSRKLTTTTTKLSRKELLRLEAALEAISSEAECLNRRGEVKGYRRSDTEATQWLRSYSGLEDAE